MCLNNSAINVDFFFNFFLLLCIGSLLYFILWYIDMIHMYIPCHDYLYYQYCLVINTLLVITTHPSIRPQKFPIPSHKNRGKL